MTRKKKGLLPGPLSASKSVRRSEQKSQKDRRQAKLERRKPSNKQQYMTNPWSTPAPSHLVARLEPRKLNSKYHSYYEFADNPERQKKKLEFQVTDNPNPQPGFKFVPIGDPILTQECKDISRELGAMIFIVSASKEENSKISEHIYRTGYHFRESIVDEARAKLGERATSILDGLQKVEPIPESQDEINKQADAAIRDLFPRIPNTDRQMIIEHAFRKGGLFHGEPTVGLQPNIPLSRRVQLAVLAHIRHTHTRYDRLLRETTWVNARKAVEPVCLDVLVKWRSDEETGRDQLEEILREVVIITESDDSDGDSDDDSDDDDSSDEEGEFSSASLGEITNPNSRNELRPANQHTPVKGSRAVLRETIRGELRGSNSFAPYDLTKVTPPQLHREKRMQRGFKRYQAAWDQARKRQETNPEQPGFQLDNHILKPRQSDQTSSINDTNYHHRQTSPQAHRFNLPQDHRYESSMVLSRQDSYHSQQAQRSAINGNEVIVRPLSERPLHYQNPSQRTGSASPSNMEPRPSILVRRTIDHNLQDMLVPSIETSSSDAPVGSLRPVIGRGSYCDLEQNPYMRPAVEWRMHETEPHQVILIEDDSPPHKRRRVIQQDDLGRFRPPLHEQTVCVPAPQAESHLIPAASARSRIQESRLSSHPNQGLSRYRPLLAGEPGQEYRIPIYEPLPKLGYLPPNSGNFRRVEANFWSGHQQEVSLASRQGGFHNNPIDMEQVRRSNQDMRIIDREYPLRHFDIHPHRSSPIRQLPLPKFSVQNTVSCSYEPGLDPLVVDRDFIHDFSQSRNHPSLSRGSDGFTILSERSPQNFISRNSIAPHSYGATSAGPSRTLDREQASFQGQYLQSHNYRP